MFHAIRSWWAEGRGKLTARLFLFEFIVVVAGVLVAQAVAGWAQKRDELADMESEHKRMRVELRDTHEAAQVWLTAIPCFRLRMDEVMARKEFAPGALKRPSFVLPGYAPPSTETMDLLAERHGFQQKIDYSWLNSNGTEIGEAATKIRESWGRIMLADPAQGEVTPEDRAAARVAAADIEAQLQLIERLSRAVVRLSRKLGIEATNPYDPGTGPAKSCDAIWSSGQINPPLGMR